MLQSVNRLSRMTTARVAGLLCSRNRYRFIYLVALAVFLSQGASVRAELASEQEMRNVSQNFVTQKVARAGQWAADSSPAVGEAHELWYKGVLVARYYDVSPRGYVLVPVLKEMNPVKAYSDESNLDENQEGGFLRMVGEVLYEQMRLYESLYGSLDVSQPTDEQLYDPSQKRAWQRLAVPAREFRTETAQGTTSQAGPLLTSSWHQKEPYNNFCPMGNIGRTVVGCAATATAQLMKFWEWPETGVGSHSYMWMGDRCEGYTPAQVLTVDYSDSYDWVNMPDDCNSGCSSTQEDALAELNYEVGVAYNMEYSGCGSGANGGLSSYVLTAYFNYKSSLQESYRVNYTQEGWFDLIRSEIDVGRPMLYYIHSHAIICDGYRDDYGQLEFHMNYGWNNSYTTWYVLDNLYCGWYPGKVCPWEFEFVDAGIQPEHDPVLVLQRADATDIAPDGDTLIMAGETAQLHVTVVNRGFDAVAATGTLSTSDPYLTLTNAVATFDPTIPSGEESDTQTPFELTVDPDCPNPHTARVRIDITTGDFVFVDSFCIFVGNVPGFEDDLESGSGNWYSRDFTVSYVDEWHLETSRSHSGATSWKAGGAGSASYNRKSDGALVTSPLLLPPKAKLSFWHWIDAMLLNESSAYDGGIVMIRPSGGNWAQIVPVSGYSHHIQNRPAFGGPLEPYTPCYSGSQDWSEAVFDLSDYSGVVEIMFRFSSIFYIIPSGWYEEGWYIDDVWVGNTMEGADVQLNLLPNLSVTFESVLTRGITTATLSDTGPLPPPGYAPVPGGPVRYYDMFTDAVFSGNADLCISYDEAEVTGSESRLELLHYEGGSWVDVTTSLNTETNQICGSASSLSPFLVAERLTCCIGRVGNANGEGDYPDEVTLGDIMLMVDVKFISGDCSKLPCLAEADVNQDGGTNPNCDDHVTLGDIMTLVDFLFITGPDVAVLPECL
jgi:hypothetical protein